MKKQQLKTPNIDEYLNNLKEMKSVAPKDFFYDRLINRLANEQQPTPWSFPLKPVWMICSLVVLLLVNTVILLQKDKTKIANSFTGIQNFANAYDQQISSY